MTLVLSSAELVKQLRQRFGNRGGTDLTLEETIIPITNVGDLDEPPWHSKGGGVINLTQAAVVGQTSYAGIIAPATLPPNFRAVIKAVINLGAVNIGLGIIDSSVITTLVSTPIQFSWDQLGRPAAQSSLGSNAVSIGATGWFMAPLANGAAPHMLKWVIAPGQTLIAQSLLPNQAISVGFYWDEYYLG